MKFSQFVIPFALILSTGCAESSWWKKCNRFWGRETDSRLVSLQGLTKDVSELPVNFFQKVAEESQCYQGRKQLARLCQTTTSEAKMELASYITNCHLEAASVPGFHWNSLTKLGDAHKDYVTLVMNFVPHITDMCSQVQHNTALTFFNTNIENENKLFELIVRLLKNAERIKVESENVNKQTRKQDLFMKHVEKIIKQLGGLAKKANKVIDEIYEQRKQFIQSANNITMLIEHIFLEKAQYTNFSRTEFYAAQKSLERIMQEFVRNEAEKTQRVILEKLELQQNETRSIFSERISKFSFEKLKNSAPYAACNLALRIFQASKTVITAPRRLGKWLDNLVQSSGKSHLQSYVALVNQIFNFMSFLLLYTFSSGITSILWIIGESFGSILSWTKAYLVGKSGVNDTVDQSRKLNALNIGETEKDTLLNALSSRLSLCLERQTMTELTLKAMERRLETTYEILTDINHRGKITSKSPVKTNSTRDAQNLMEISAADRIDTSSSTNADKSRTLIRRRSRLINPNVASRKDKEKRVGKSIRRQMTREDNAVQSTFERITRGSTIADEDESNTNSVNSFQSKDEICTKRQKNFESNRPSIVGNSTHWTRWRALQARKGQL